MSDSNSKTAKQRLQEAFFDGIPVPPPDSDAPDYSSGLEALAEAVEENQDTIATINDEISGLRRLYESLEAKMKGTGSASDVAHEAATNAAEARNGVESNGRAIDDLEGRLERVDARSLRTKTVAEDVKTRLEKVDGWIEAFGGRVVDVEETTAELEQRLIELKTDHSDDLEARVEKLEARTKRVANTATANRDASEEANAKADDTDKVLGEVLGRMDQLEGRFDRLEARVETLLDIVAT